MQLYEPVHDRFVRYCDSKTNNKEDSKDLVSETIATAYENFEKIREEKAFLYFLFGTAHRIYLNQLRRNKFKETYSSEFEDTLKDPNTSPDMQVEISLFYNQLKSLGEEIEELIILKEISGFSVKEVAEMKNMTESNVKVKLHRGRKKLKELLHEPQILDHE